MRLAVLSGKGGTGKTLLSVNLAALLEGAQYLDCDVEAPNGRLFFRPEVTDTKKVYVKMPMVNHEKCDGCRLCVDFCNFNAMAFIGNRVKVFEDICHSCGGCQLICPQNAIEEVDKPIGVIEKGLSEKTHVATGIMNIGQASGVPIVDGLIDIGNSHQGHVIVDCPPGSACIVMESIKDADHCVIVAEPTIFGVHNMKMVYELVVKMGKSVSVIINKSYGDDQQIIDFCTANAIPIHGVIAFDEKLGALGSEGRIAVREEVHYNKMFSKILEHLLKEVAHETASCS